MLRGISSLLLLVLVGCVEYPGNPPTEQELVGTWVPKRHEMRPPAKFLCLSSDHTFIATNFPLPTMQGKSHRSGAGVWKLDEYLRIQLRFPGETVQLEVKRRRSPFLLDGNLDSSDEDLVARRLEDLKK